MAKHQLRLFEGGSVIVEVDKPQLRPYQSKGIDDMRSLIGQGCKRILLTMPTGGGKTVVASYIIDASQAYKRRVLFVAHRTELINQTAKQLARFGVTDIGVIKAADKRWEPNAAVQIASIDTLRNRALGDWIPDIIVIDECHRALADSYRVLFTIYPEALHIGLTATPFRTDNQGLGELYEAIVICAKPSELMADRFIECPRTFAGPLAPDLSSVYFSQLAHDYHNGQLATAMMKRGLVGNIVEEWQKRAENRRTVCFAVNVEHSKMIVEEFNHACVRAAHIDGTTPADDRLHILLKLEKGDIKVVSNCDVLTEGWDQPSVKCTILARPTQSLRMHLQQTGRPLRPFEGITPIILDHAGNCARHGLPQEDRVFDLSVGQKRTANPTCKTCEKCYAIFSSTAKACPECGWVNPTQEKAQLAHDKSVDLVEISSRAIVTDADRERLFFLRELEKARKSGMKPGAIGFRFKEKFHKWPPWAWSQQATSMFNSDAGWQELSNQRAAVRSHWEQHRQDQQQPSQRQPQPESDFTPEYQDDDEIPF